MPANPSCKFFGVGGAIITTGHIITNPLKAEATQLANNRAALAVRSVVQLFFVVARRVCRKMQISDKPTTNCRPQHEYKHIALR